VYSLLAVFAVVGLVPLASVAGILIHVNREALTTSQQQLQLLLVSSIAADVDTHVEALRQRVAATAGRVGQILETEGGIRADGLERLQVSSAETYVVYLRFSDRKGREVSSDPGARLPEAIEAVIGESMTAAAERNAVSDGVARTWLSAPILTSAPGRDALLVVSAPVRAAGRPAGAIAAVVHFGSMWDPIVERMARGRSVFALTPDGVPFVSTGAEEVVPGMDMSRSEIVSRFLATGDRASETTPFRWTVGGEEELYLGSYERTDEGWGIFVQARESEIYQPVRSMIESTLSWAAVVVGLAILAAMVFARTLSTPIDRLAAATRSFADGDFTKRVSVRSRNEIGELAETFNGMADQIELHIDKLRRAARENAELFLGTIRALANAIDAKDPYTRGHSVRVNRYSVIIATYLGLPRPEIEKIHVASVMHDVGKIGIHDRILQKPGALSREEFQIMKTHTTRGAEIMSPIPQMREVIPGLRSHHERWNGTGYPDGLKGEEIPLMARIIAVADTFDAMTTKRPYQDPFTFDEAVARINELKGLGFDETVVEAFNRAYAAGEFRADPTARPAAESASTPSERAAV